MSRLMFIFAFALLPTVALAQSHFTVDCTAYRRTDDGLWAVTRPNVIVVDGKSISINMTNACCYGADRSRLVIKGVNIINLVQRSC